VTVSLVLLGTAIALGEVLVLRIGLPCPLPLAYAWYPVVAARCSAPAFAVTVAAGTVVGIIASRSVSGDAARKLLGRVTVAAAVIVGYRLTFAAYDHREATSAVLAALAVAAFAAVAADELVRVVTRRPSAFAGRGLLAWLTVGSSGALMALGYRGIDGRGIVGLWGVLLFATPLLAAWYAFERLDKITRISSQTVEALSLVPEFAGIASVGHGERVATVAVHMGEWLGLGAHELTALDTAARLHHLGEVTLDGDLDELRAPRSIIDGEAGTASAVLRVADAYDELVAGREVRGPAAIDALRSAPEDAYDPVVVDALVAVVEERADVARRV
jgi:hypothetical protein